MVILGVDYGDARTGIAVCDKYETLASPVKVIHQWNQEKLIEEINDIVSQLNPELIVVGLPKNMDSSIGDRGQKCIDFAKNLQNRTNIECVLRDERLTTVSAHIALSNNNVRGKKRKETVDEVAATFILQDFIDSRKK